MEGCSNQKIQHTVIYFPLIYLTTLFDLGIMHILKLMQYVAIKHHFLWPKCVNAVSLWRLVWNYCVLLRSLVICCNLNCLNRRVMYSKPTIVLTVLILGEEYYHSNYWFCNQKKIDNLLYFVHIFWQINPLKVSCWLAFCHKLIYRGWQNGGGYTREK